MLHQNQMFIRTLIGPEDLNPKEKQNPTWADIESAIMRINGQTCTLLIIAAGDPTPHMAIGGGLNGKYIVYITPDNLTFYNLVNPNAESEICSLVAGGQQGDYSLKMCVAIYDVLRAAKAYAETGQCDQSLMWEIDEPT